MSNTERDELAEVIRDTDLLGCGCCGASTEVQVGPDEWDVAYPAREEALAIKLLTAGYRKPRTITTVEELDALPVGSVVLYNGRAFQHYPAYPAPFDEYQKWKCGDGGFVRSTKDGSSILPTSVLWEPAA